MKILKIILIYIFYPFIDPFISMNTRCKWSEKYFDMHDYTESKGGDGIPKHFHVYTCSNCEKKIYNLKRISNYVRWSF